MENRDPGSKGATSGRQVVHINSRPISSPGNAPPPVRVSVDGEELNDLWEHATLLLDNFDFSGANKTFKSLLKQSSRTDTAKARLWANVGIVHAHLGENHLAHHALAKAAKLEPSCSVIWYYLGCVNYELQDYRRAKRFFEACENTIAPGIEYVDYSEMGFHGDSALFKEFKFVLNRTELRWNGQQCFFWYQHKKHGAPLPYERAYGINRVPGGHHFRINSTGWRGVI
jgi:tetratricopeptide (TPR) repeat protein